jgi:hypothetical protein
MQGKPGPNCSVSTSLNMVIGQCIRRELFFQCPGLASTDTCKALVTFGQACPMFPMPPRPQGGLHIGGPPPPGPPMPKECENAPKTNLSECCPVYPKFEHEKAKMCMETCGQNIEKNVEKKAVKSDGKGSNGAPKCCMTDCILTAFGFLKNGTFDAVMAKKAISLVATDKSWTSAVS